PCSTLFPYTTLFRSIFEAAERPRYRTAGREERRDVDRVDSRRGARPWTLDHHVAVGDLVVHDGEPDAAVVQPRRDAQIRARRLEQAARVIVEQQLAAHGDPRQGEHGVDRPPRDDPR